MHFTEILGWLPRLPRPHEFWTDFAQKLRDPGFRRFGMRSHRNSVGSHCQNAYRQKGKHARGHPDDIAKRDPHPREQITVKSLETLSWEGCEKSCRPVGRPDIPVDVLPQTGLKLELPCCPLIARMSPPGLTDVVAKNCESIAAAIDRE